MEIHAEIKINYDSNFFTIFQCSSVLIIIRKNSQVPESVLSPKKRQYFFIKKTPIFLIFNVAINIIQKLAGSAMLSVISIYGSGGNL
ncbi:hypothetical protein CW304_02930 [Bacillus sp. UFRGS-B20]|nr:hypothetical protein CW304_02930 [Bacillus sp. UFRGS-B20]